jgi:hypothetical protein
MLEYCPEEMSAEQTAEWGKHQIPAPSAASTSDDAIPMGRILAALREYYKAAREHPSKGLLYNAHRDAIDAAFGHLPIASPSSAVPLVEKIEELQRAVPPEEWDKLQRSSASTNADDMRVQCPKCERPVNYVACPYCGADQYDREGFYEKLWKDFVSLQRGDAVGIVEKVERYYREQASESHERSNDPNLLADLSVALDDWLHQYAPEHCDDDQVRTRAKRIFDMGGTLYYLAGLQKRIRAAIEQPSATRRHSLPLRRGRFLPDAQRRWRVLSQRQGGRLAGERHARSGRLVANLLRRGDQRNGIDAVAAPETKGEASPTRRHGEVMRWLADLIIRRAMRTPSRKGHLFHADGSVYMTRWQLFETRWLSARVHYIATPDNDRHLHDHPGRSCRSS